MIGTRGIGVLHRTGKAGLRTMAVCLAVVLLAGSGCADKQSVPSGILPLSKMQNVMWDMIQADQYAALAIAKDSSARSNAKAETLKLYEEVFRLHDVSREEFHKSYQYYLDHPELNQLLFDSLIAQGTRLRTESYSRPFTNRQPSAVPSHTPTGPTLPTPGKTPLHSTTILPGRSPIFPPHQPGVVPGLHPGTFPTKPQKDSARKHL